MKPYQISQIIRNEGLLYKTFIQGQTTYLTDVLSFILDLSICRMFVEMKEIDIKNSEEHYQRFRILSSIFLADETLCYAFGWHQACMANL